MTDSQRIERCFREGELAAEVGRFPDDQPYPPESMERHWWTRGFSYKARLLRAIEAEQTHTRGLTFEETSMLHDLLRDAITTHREQAKLDHATKKITDAELDWHLKHAVLLDGLRKVLLGEPRPRPIDYVPQDIAMECSARMESTLQRTKWRYRTNTHWAMIHHVCAALEATTELVGAAEAALRHVHALPDDREYQLALAAYLKEAEEFYKSKEQAR